MRTGALKKLKATQLKSLSDGVHSDGGGLYLRVRGEKQVWIFRFTRDGKKREMGLGPTTLVSLSTARERAEKARTAVANGLDPIEVRKGMEAPAKPASRPKTITFEDAMLRHIGKHRNEWSSGKHQLIWENSLRNHAAPLMEKDVAGIAVTDIETLLDPIWSEKQDTARRVRQRIERVMAGCIVRGEAPAPNPAAWKDNLEIIMGKVSRQSEGHGMVAVEDVPEVINALTASDAMGARMNILIAHTSLRSGAARTLEWDDVQHDMIVVPAERVKMRRPHRVPVSAALAAFLHTLPRYNSWPFVLPRNSPGRPMSDMTASKVLKKLYPGAVPHGWRSTFPTWAAQNGYDRILAEDQLAHSLGDNAIESAYLRSDLAEQRRDICNAWPDFLVSAI